MAYFRRTTTSKRPRLWWRPSKAPPSGAGIVRGSGGVIASGFKSTEAAAVIRGTGRVISIGDKQGYGRTLENQFPWSEDISKYVLHVGANAIGADYFGGYSYGLAFPNAIVETPVGQQTGYFVAEETDTTGHHGYGKRSIRVGWLAAGDRVNYREWIDYSNAGKDWFRFECYDGSKATSQYKRAWFNWNTKSWGTVDAGLTAVATLDANGYYKFELSWVAAGDGGTDFQYVDVAGASGDGSTSTYLGSSGNSWNTWGRQLWFGFSSMPYVTTQRMPRYGSMLGGGRVWVSQEIIGGANIVSGTGRVISAGIKAAFGTASIRGEGRVISLGNKEGSAIAHVRGEGRVISAGEKAASSTGVIKGNGNILFTGLKNGLSVAAIGGAGQPVSYGQKDGASSVIISGSGGAVSAGLKGGQGIAIVNSSGAVYSVGFKAASNTALASGSGRVYTVGQAQSENFTGTAVVSGSGRVYAAGFKGAESATVVRGSGGADSEGTKSGVGSAFISSAGSVATFGLAGRAGSAVISSSGSVYSTGEKAAFSVASVSGTGRVYAVGEGNITANANVSGSGNVTAAGFKSAYATSIVGGSGDVESGGISDRSGTALIDGAGNVITVEVEPFLDTDAVVRGSGRVYATSGIKNAMGSAIISGGGRIIVVIDDEFPTIPTEPSVSCCNVGGAVATFSGCVAGDTTFFDDCACPS